MALDPNYLDSLPQSLIEMYSLVEIDILEDMARRISTYDYFIPAAMHQSQKLQELGMTQQYIIEALSGMTGQTQQEIVDLLTEASEVAIEDDVEYYTRAEVYKPSEINTEALHKQLNSGLLQTQQAFKNITKTTANTATKQFENALDRAWTQISSGAFDYNTAIERACKDLAREGIGVIRYPSGHIDTLEVAVRRAVVTGVNQTAGKVQEVLADELDVDLVEVTAHGGARPEHAKWQGKCYSRNGRKVIDGVVYEDFRTATRYGHGDGLKGWNCHHDFHPYIHGAPRTWTDREIKKLEEKKIKYNGKLYTEYEASQEQRKIERNIRALKREIAVIEEIGGDASAERSKLKKANKAYTDFTEQTKLKKQPARTKIATEKGTDRPEPNKKATNILEKQNVTPVQTKQKNQDTAENNGLTNNVNSDTIVSEKTSPVMKATNLSEVKQYIMDEYPNAYVDSSVKKIDFVAAKEAISGVDRILQEFPQAKSVLTSIATRDIPGAVMGSSYSGGIVMDRTKFEKGNTEIEKFLVVGETTSETGAHEAGHLLERALIDKYGGNEDDWNNCTFARKIIEEAVSEINKKTGDTYNWGVYAYEVSYYAANVDESECLAECVGYYYMQGEEAADLAKEVWKILKKELS